MKNFLPLLFCEIKIQNRIYNTARSCAQFLFLGAIAIIFVHGASADLAKFGIIFTIIALPLSILNSGKSIIKADISDGYMELLMTTTSPIKIVLAKFCGLLLSNILGFIIALPSIFFFYPISTLQFLIVSGAGTLLLTQITTISVLIGCVEGYFRTNTNLASILILPLIVPGLIISGMMASESQNWLSFAGILCGIDFIVIPVAIILSAYLTRNIYNT